MKLIIRLSLLAFVSINAFKTEAQFINHNGNIKINREAYIVVRDIDFRNVEDGTVDNDGHIVLSGADWVNDGNNNMLVNLNEDGEVKMAGAGEQSIKGGRKTVFEGLTIWQGKTKLEIDDCEVNNKLELMFDGVLDLNLNRFIINNRNPEAISADETSYIQSENIGYDYSGWSPNDEVYGDLQWNIGDNTATYNVPFGSKDGEKLNLRVSTKSAGSPSTGNIVFATYPTNYDNMPLPSEVNTLGKLTAKNLVDRYWKVKANYDLKPNADLGFGVLEKDINGEHNELVNGKSMAFANNPGLKRENLLGIRFNSISRTWNDMPAKGVYNSTGRMVHVIGVNSGDFQAWWTLTTKSKLDISNVFTPNDDGHNDSFIPQFSYSEEGVQDSEVNGMEGIIDLKGQIFNRWGNVIYEWSNDNWWDGTSKGKDAQEGTYFYVVTAKGTDGKEYDEKGTVTLLRK